MARQRDDRGPKLELGMSISLENFGLESLADLWADIDIQ